MYDQPLMNWKRAALGILVYSLSPDFNFLVWPFPATNRFRASIIHYASLAKQFMRHDVGVVMDMYVNGRSSMMMGVSQYNLRWLGEPQS